MKKVGMSRLVPCGLTRRGFRPVERLRIDQPDFGRQQVLVHDQLGTTAAAHQDHVANLLAQTIERLVDLEAQSVVVATRHELQKLHELGLALGVELTLLVVDQHLELLVGDREVGVHGG
jgi:hypothetical protein